MTLLDLIVRWNGGIKKGAKTRFARELDVSHAAVSRWCTRRSIVDERRRALVAEKLGIDVPALMAAWEKGGASAYASGTGGSSFVREGSRDLAREVTELKSAVVKLQRAVEVALRLKEGALAGPGFRPESVGEPPELKRRK